MNAQEIDKRLFELCKPEGVRASVISDFGGLWRADSRWSPSENWYDLEPLIAGAWSVLRARPCFYMDDGDEWRAKFERDMDDAGRVWASAKTLCLAASLALIALLESSHAPDCAALAVCNDNCTCGKNK